MFAVVPLILTHHGDPRRNPSPYVLTGGTTYADLNTANSAMRRLTGLGFRCGVVVL